MKKKKEDDILNRLAAEVIPKLEGGLKKKNKDSFFLLEPSACRSLDTLKARINRERVTSKNGIAADQSALEEIEFDRPLSVEQVKTVCAIFRRFEIRRARYQSQSAKATETVQELIESGAGEKILSARSQNAAKARKSFEGNEQKLFDRASSGGKSRKESLSKADRSSIAKKAAEARWNKEEKPEAEKPKPADGKKKK